MSAVTFPANTTTLLVNTLFTSKIVYLPAIRTANPGTIYFIKDICGNAAVSSIYIFANGTDTIERQNPGTATALLNANFGSIMLTPDGLNNWMVLQHYNANTVGKLWRYLPSTPIGLTLTLNPQNGYLIANWPPVPYTNSYTLTLYQNTTQAIGGSATILQTYTGLTSVTAITTAALTASYYYYYSLLASNTLGNSATVTSPLIQANLYPAPPTGVLVSFTYPSIIVTWTASPSATSYSVIFYTSATPTQGSGLAFQVFYGVTSTSQATTNSLLNLTYYYATVIAVNSAGNSVGVNSSNSALANIPPGAVPNASITFTFTTASVPPRLTCNWSSGLNATSYTIIFYQSATPGTSGGTTFETDVGTIGLSQNTSTIPLNTYYYYATVTSVNIYDSSSAVTTSNYAQAVTQAAPTASASIIFSFPNAATNPGFTCSWQTTDARTASYTIVFYQSATPGTTGGTSFQTFTGNTNITQTSSAIPTNNYYIYATVTSVNLYVNSSPVSTTNYVQALIYPPGPTTVTVSFYFPTPTATPAIQCNWSAVTTAASYTIVFYQSATPATTGGTLFETDTGIIGTSQTTTTTVLNNYYYYATVTSVNAYGSSTAITSTLYVQAILTPFISSATMSFSGNQVTATWVPSPNSASYTLVFYQVATQVTTGGTVLESFSRLTTSSKTSVTSLTNTLYYYATVTPINSYGTGPTFTTTNVIQAAILPTGGAIILNSSLTITNGGVTITTPATNSTNYTIYISPTTSTANSVTSFTTTTVGSEIRFDSSLLTENTYYYALLVPSNANGSGGVTATSLLTQAGRYLRFNDGPGTNIFTQTNTIDILVVGGGGGGGNGGGFNGGGGAGGFVYVTGISVRNGITYSWKEGAGGSAGTNGSDSYLIVNGITYTGKGGGHGGNGNRADGASGGCGGGGGGFAAFGASGTQGFAGGYDTGGGGGMGGPGGAGGGAGGLGKQIPITGFNVFYSTGGVGGDSTGSPGADLYGNGGGVNSRGGNGVVLVRYYI